MLDAKFCPACGYHFHSGPIEESSIDASIIEETKSDTTGKSDSAEICYNCNTVLKKMLCFAENAALQFVKNKEHNRN
ncbi:hypothetical protein ACNQFZ_09650 [Schinkia sp. CFF1]